MNAREPDLTERDDGMPGRAADLIEIPDSLWQRAEMIEALHRRDIGRMFHLLRQYTGTSQTRLAIACGMTQPNLGKVDVTERRASFLLDTARAFLQYGKHDKAYLALRAAEEMAPEEIAGRPAVHRLVRDLITSAPPSTQRQAEDFAHRIGVTR